MYYHLILTERCNSNCRYCYEKSIKEFDNGLDKRFEFDFNIPEDLNIDLNKLKNFISKDKNPKIIFYGGEPLLKIEKIKQIIDNLSDLDVSFYIQTNGKLLNKIPGDYLKKFNKLLISIDGSKERTDFNRGKGTYDLVLKNIDLIRKKGFKGEIVARMTVAQDCPDIYEQLTNLLKTGKFDSYHWQIDAGFYKNDFNKTFSGFVEKYNNSISKLTDFWFNQIKQGKVIKLYPFLGIFESLHFNKKTKLRCGSGYANYTITTNGKITACPITNNIKDFYCGDLDSEPSKLKEIYVGSPCNSCKYLNICGGRCLYSNKAKLWPEQGKNLICKTIIHLIKEISERVPQIRDLIKEEIVSEEEFEYEKYFGPEIIP